MQNNFVFADYFITGRPWGVLHDRPWEKFAEGDIPEYIKDGYEIFLKRLNDFRSLDRKLTPMEEHELEFMLSSLIHAKNVLFEDPK